MEDNSPELITVFDKQVQTRRIQMLKAAIPYIQFSNQKALSLYVKTIELLNTLKLFSAPENDIKICEIDEENKFSSMLNDIKPYCTDNETETVDQLINMINTFNLYKSYNDSTESPFDTFKDMFNNIYESEEPK